MTAAARGTRSWSRALAMPLLAVAVVALSACSTPVDTGPEPSLSGSETKLSTTNTFYGQMIADGAGRTLYQFDGDRDGVPTCYGPCAAVWQPYIATGVPVAAERNVNPLEEAQIDTVQRQGGEQQVRYQNRPLYFFVGDQRPADVGGVGKQEFGGTWTGVTTLGSSVIP